MSNTKKVSVEVTDASEFHCFRVLLNPAAGEQVELMFHATALVELIHEASVALCAWQYQTTSGILRKLGHPELIAKEPGA